MKDFNFWHWFAFGLGAKAGFRRLLGAWLVAHIIIGIAMAFLVTSSAKQSANTVLLPLAGILIGLSFAWSGSAQALLQTEEMQEIARHRKGGIFEYVYVFQLAILIILVTVCAWGLAGLGVYERIWPLPANQNTHFVVKTILFALASLTIRECWHVVMGVQWMLISQQKLKDGKLAKSNVEPPNTPVAP